MRALLPLLAPLSLVACSTLRVDTDYDPDADFERLATYAWRQPAAGRAPNDPLLAKRVHEAVDDGLAARGYVKDERDPDFTVGWFAIVRQRVDVSTFDDPWGSRRWPRWRTTTWVTTWDEETLVLDVADARTGEPLWRGIASDVVEDDATPQERERRVREAVTELLERFPPDIEDEDHD